MASSSMLLSLTTSDTLGPPPLHPWECRHCGFELTVLLKQPVSPDLICCICKLLLKQPVQSFCGHRFCLACALGASPGNPRGIPRPCPQCLLDPEEMDMQEPTILSSDTIYPDNATKRMMMRQAAKCINEGCDWTGTFAEYEMRHYPDCAYHVVTCPTCSQRGTVQEFKLHQMEGCGMREVECELCHETMPAAHVERHLSSECPEIEVTCESCDAAPMKRKQLQEHYANRCNVFKKACPYGCRFIFVEPAKLWQHEGLFQVQHTKRELQRVVELERGVQCTEVSSTEDTTTDDFRAIAEMVEQVTLKLENASSGTRSIDEHSQPSQIHIKIKSLEDKGDDCLKTIGSLSEKLEYWDDLNGQKNLVIMQNAKRSMEKLKDNEKKDEGQTLIFGDLKTRLTLLEEASFTGTYVWTIHNFTSKLEDAKRGGQQNFLSQIFFTDRYGYSMRLKMYPNGDGFGKGKKLSLYFLLVKGEFDALLKWPFCQKVKFMILNQNTPGRNNIEDSFQPERSNSSFQRPRLSMNVATGCPSLASHEQLRNGGPYVQNDTLFIKCIVDISNLDSAA